MKAIASPSPLKASKARKSAASSGSAYKKVKRDDQILEAEEDVEELNITSSTIRSTKFSKITSLEQLERLFEVELEGLQIEPFLKDENRIERLSEYQLQKLSSGLVVAEKIVFITGEKSLYFPIYDLLKFPVLLTNLSLQITEEEEGEEEADEEYAYPTHLYHELALEDKAANAIGPVEFVIKHKDEVVFIVEVKKRIFLAHGAHYTHWTGIYQLLAQMLSTMRAARGKKVMFGALTDLFDWIFVRMEETGESTYKVQFSEMMTVFAHSGGLWSATSQLPLFFSYLLQILLAKSDAKNVPDLLNRIPTVESMIEDWSQKFRSNYLQQESERAELAEYKLKSEEYKLKSEEYKLENEEYKLENEELKRKLNELMQEKANT